MTARLICNDSNIDMLGYNYPSSLLMLLRKLTRVIFPEFS